MHSTTILLLALGLLATVAMARPGRRPRPDHHHGDSSSEISEEHHGSKWATYRMAKHLRIPQRLADKLGRPWPTFTAKKILGGKYMLISPALLFRVKEANNETDSTTTATPESSTGRPTRPTTEEPIVEESTTPSVDEESTTVAPTEEESTTVAPTEEESTTTEVDEEETTTEVDEEETTTARPSSFRKRSFALNDNEHLLFLDD